MTPALAPGAVRPASGVGRVRAFAGLGCASACACKAPSGLGFTELVKSPAFIGIAGVVLVAGVVLIREAMR